MMDRSGISRDLTSAAQEVLWVAGQIASPDASHTSDELGALVSELDQRVGEISQAQSNIEELKSEAELAEDDMLDSEVAEGDEIAQLQKEGKL